jgi:hypothetical protein
MTQEDAHLDPAVFVTTPGEDLTEPACLPALTDFSQRCNTGQVANMARRVLLLLLLLILDCLCAN